MDHLQEAKDLLTTTQRYAADDDTEALALIATAHALVALVELLQSCTIVVEEKSDG